MSRKLSQLREELLDREAIRDAIFACSRGVDRGDLELMASAFWPDAQIEAVRFSGSRDEFVEFAVAASQNEFPAVTHLIGNVFIQLDGAAASVESYVYSYHAMNPGAGPREIIIAGRYVDRFECRDDEWRIAQRLVLIDWYREHADTADWAPGPLGVEVARGEKYPRDRSYALFSSDLATQARVDVTGGDASGKIT